MSDQYHSDRKSLESTHHFTHGQKSLENSHPGRGSVILDWDTSALRTEIGINGKKPIIIVIQNALKNNEV